MKLFAWNDAKNDGYAYIIPFVEEEEVIFLKTIIPGRKMAKLYLGGNRK